MLELMLFLHKRVLQMTKSDEPPVVPSNPPLSGKALMFQQYMESKKNKKKRKRKKREKERKRRKEKEKIKEKS